MLPIFVLVGGVPKARQARLASMDGLAWDDEGEFPAVVIVGVGKCGTNALAAALKTLHPFQSPDTLNSWTVQEERERMGGAGEINWPCANWHDEGIKQYKRHFFVSNPQKRQKLGKISWLDKSTSLYGCAKNVSAALPESTKILGMLCDPLKAVWSRMNHERSMGDMTSTPDTLMRTVRARLEPNSPICGELAMRDNTVNRQICYQFEESIHYEERLSEWQEATHPSRVHFFLAEPSLAQPDYLVRAASKILDIQAPGITTMGSVHSHSKEAGYLDASGPQWESYAELAGPRLRKMVQSIAKSSFQRKMLPNSAQSRDPLGGEDVTHWWPWSLSDA